MGAFTAAVARDGPVLPVANRGHPIDTAGGDPQCRAVAACASSSASPSTPQPDASAWAAAVTLRDRARRHILTHCGEPDLAHESNVVDA